MPIKNIITLFICLLSLSNQIFGMDNPISYEDGINDCDVIKYNGEYYITGNWLGGDMFRSRNLTDWGERKHIFSPDNTWHVPRNSNPDMDVHGTHIAYENGIFHLYAHLDTTETLGIVHAISDNVMGPYTEPIDAPIATWTIDVKTFKDEDGSLHYYSTRFGGVSGNHNDYREMSDYYTFTSDYRTLIWPTGGWEINPELPAFSPPNGVPTINEGPFVFKNRDKYYMLYNANHTGDTSYAIGCAMSDEPDGFDNSGKNSEPVLGKVTYNNGTSDYEIYTIGQPWVVDGLNGFEKWAGYFAIDGNEKSEGRTQRIDRVHFLDRKMYIDGPTNRYTQGYHPGPAEPQLRSLFYIPDGLMPNSDWVEVSPNGNYGQWEVKNNEAYQSSESCFSFNLVNRKPAKNYLFEANVKMCDPQDSEDKAGIVAYYKDSQNWMIIGFDRSLGYNADGWYCLVSTDDYHGVIATGGFNGKLDYSVYHKIRVEKNDSIFKIWIDDVLPPGFSDIVTDITDAGVPGIYSDHSSAVYDGIIYTIGWDEYDDNITGWGNGVNNNQAGSYTVGNDGLKTVNSYNNIYKGDLMPEYEFSTHVYKIDIKNNKMGVIAVAIDQSNYLRAYFDLANNRFTVDGKKDGNAISKKNMDIADKDDYNLRVVKLADRLIFFIDGKEALTYEISFPASQVGLYTANMYARFNGIGVYQIESGALPYLWENTDVGIVGFEGNAKFNHEGTFTVNGSGADIWDRNDGFHFVYQELYGDGEIVARIVSSDFTDWWSKSAIMIRDGLESNSGMAMIDICAHGKLEFIWRNGPGYGTGIIEAPNNLHSDMIWVKLRRMGLRFYAYYSYNGVNWTYIGSCLPGFNSSYLKIGLAVTAHNNSRINGAVFDNVTIKGCTPGDYRTDLNHDCNVNAKDLELLIEKWLENVPTDTQADFDNNQIIDLGDYSILADDWLISYDD